jgi:hypothetical protein
LDEESAYDSRADTLMHIQQVRDNIGLFVTEMLARARVHDASKLQEPEKSTFDRVLPSLAGVAYGSRDHEAIVERHRAVLDLHHQRNSHHPEHYGSDGVAGMDLFDIVEMVCDWMAAAERRPEDGVRLDYNVALFGIQPQLASVLANTLARWPGHGCATAG